MKLRRAWLIIFALALAGCASAQSSTGTSSPAAPPSTAATPPPLATTVILGSGQLSDLPVVRERMVRVEAAIKAPPFILLRTDLDPQLAAAQEVAANDPRVQAATVSPSGQRLRTEVMTVGKARAGDVTPAVAAKCPPDSCVRVVLYVYPSNSTVTATVDDRAQVIDVQVLDSAQPEIPQDLADLATQIAIHDPQVAAAFEGLTPSEAMAAMSATKTALNDTSCERSKHLCVSPVFTWGNAALWTIIDLTDFKLVAASTWTDQGTSGRRRVSEATLEDAAIAPLCDTPQSVDRDGWRASYLLTSSDGLELRDVTYQGRPMLGSAKIVDWHVGYQGQNQQRVGFSDAVGCPVFSSAAVIPYSLPTIANSPAGGFALEMIFRSPNWPQPCNYQYVFRAEFAQDGSLTVLAGNQGRGCGTTGVYQPVLRVAPPEGSLLGVWDGTKLDALTSEGMATWQAGGSEQLQVTAAAGPLTISPVWNDAELAYVYWTQAKDAEGRGDLASIGNCCALDGNQGPEQFVSGEALGSSGVLWFVPRIRNAERVRCWADTKIENGMIVSEIWPCSAGVRITREAAPAHGIPASSSPSTAPPATPSPTKP